MKYMHEFTEEVLNTISVEEIKKYTDENNMIKRYLSDEELEEITSLTNKDKERVQKEFDYILNYRGYSEFANGALEKLIIRKHMVSSTEAVNYLIHLEELNEYRRNWLKYHSLNMIIKDHGKYVKSV